ncbi:DUF2721 domain-containing protein [Stagnimonas aquatica]|uniref:DUF2721 domain-containing protein n=1 Tax=Stagnimonas aquatica TaxID=2689987 RepID=A0A3N0V249_9GAMM|nr:DUF2721 domain-containing protein [Stagnimonas aquatica]ROH86785.1 DUF2721 domain-containing protein [Stagnimonas aquatica]
MTALTFSTAGLPFPAISLLMLAYTNRFLALSGLARQLIAKHHERPSEELRAQVRNPSLRLNLLRHERTTAIRWGRFWPRTNPIPLAINARMPVPRGAPGRH